MGPQAQIISAARHRLKRDNKERNNNEKTNKKEDSKKQIIRIEMQGTEYPGYLSVLGRS